MATTIADIRNEVYGPFSYLNDSGAQMARLDKWINMAYQEVCSREKWPFLEDTATGTAPLTVTDLREIISVVDANGVYLVRAAYDTVRKIVSGDITTVGSAAYYYITDGTVINTFPVPSGSITVRYIKDPPALTSALNEAVTPDNYMDVIALGALRRAAIDNQAWEAASSYRQEWDARVQEMADDLIDRPRYQQIVVGSEDG